MLSIGKIRLWWGFFLMVSLIYILMVPPYIYENFFQSTLQVALQVVTCHIWILKTHYLGAGVSQIFKYFQISLGGKSCSSYTLQKE